MSFTFDEYETLISVDQLVGKTIARVVPSHPMPIARPGERIEPPQGWIVEFADGDVIELQAHYDDSEVFWQKPREIDRAKEGKK